MTLPVIWHDEFGVELGRLYDPGFALELLPAADESVTTACLRFIDPYGDTVFNQAQLGELILELESRRSRITDLPLRRRLDQLLEFLRPCAGQVHTYIKIVGD